MFKVDQSAKIKKHHQLVDKAGKPFFFDLVNYSACRLEDPTKIFICGRNHAYSEEIKTFILDISTGIIE